MPHKITLGQLPAGYSMSALKGPGEVYIAVREFVSSEDGDILIQRLEGIPSLILAQALPQSPGLYSTIDHMLAIIDTSRTATVYINELSFMAEMQPKRDLKKGERVLFDDIADIQRLRVRFGTEPVAIPPETGVVLLFSHGWRKGLYYDLGPLAPEGGQSRDYDIEMVLGHCFARLAFQTRLRISDDEWTELLRQRWFPFIGLSGSALNEVLAHVRNGWAVEDLLDRIYGETSSRLERQRSKWDNNPFFAPHAEFLKTAANHYQGRDFMSAICVLYPRIEGILRTYHLALSPAGKITSQALVASATVANPRIQHAHSLLVPNRFSMFLGEVFFEHFDPRNPEKLSRNTVAHGVAPAVDFNMKAATLGFLILEQLSYCLTPHTPPGS
jgi:hypothetical protein